MRSIRTESWLLPLAGISLFLGCVVLFVMWLATWNPAYLLAAFICFKMIAAR
jgi:hypothetical protein